MFGRCKVTGNVCGTDTWRAGTPCGCAECSAYVTRSQTDVRRQVIDGELTSHAVAALKLTLAGKQFGK